MISKEEYKKTLIRMWDSVRDDDYKGRNDCGGVKCACCPFTSMCDNEIIDYYDTIEFVEKWSKENPIETNGSKFLQNYPKAEVDNYDDDFIYVRLDRSILAKIPRTWWESEAK